MATLQTSPAGIEPTAPDAVESARVAGLRYVTDSQPGIRRKRHGDKFRYVDARGAPVSEAETLARIRSLAIPPAWTDVWICSRENGHLQATGRDAKGRKQYRYHPRWRTVRDETKYERMLEFGAALPKIRAQTNEDLRLPGLPKRKLLAALVQLLETTLIRVGNQEYARDNHSFGLTTMRDRHVDVNGSEVLFHFKGKSGKKHQVGLRDRRLARVISRARDIPGQELFQYLDEDGEAQSIDSADVNEYLREITGQDFTAKDFRTWAGTVIAALALQEFESFDSQAQAKRNVVQAVERVAEQLGNTPSVSRKCYIHPAIIDSYLEGTMLESLQQKTEDALNESAGLRAEEAAVLGLLRRRLEIEALSDRAKSKNTRNGKPQNLAKALKASLEQAGRKRARPAT